MCIGLIFADLLNIQKVCGESLLFLVIKSYKNLCKRKIDKTSGCRKISRDMSVARRSIIWLCHRKPVACQCGVTMQDENVGRIRAKCGKQEAQPSVLRASRVFVQHHPIALS